MLSTFDMLSLFAIILSSYVYIMFLWMAGFNVVGCLWNWITGKSPIFPRMRTQIIMFGIFSLMFIIMLNFLIFDNSASAAIYAASVRVVPLEPTS